MTKSIKKVVKSKTIFFALVLATLLTSCSFFNTEIDGQKVNVDDITKIYTSKENNKKVTGTVAFYEFDSLTSKKYKQRVREVKDGKRIKKGFDYYPNGNVNVEYLYDKNGQITGSVKIYYPEGQIYSTEEYENGKQNGITKVYNEDGTQSNEIVYSNGIKIKEYDFDKNGNKIIPVTERLEMITYKTGYYEYIDYNSNQVLYQPIVIMKWKNKSDQPLTEIIEFDGIFIDNYKQEEMAQEHHYFQGFSDPPLQPNLTRQCALKSSVGYTNPAGIVRTNISCQIMVNKKLYKTVKIKNTLLNSNRIR